MLSAIGQRELPIPEHIDIFHLTEEYPATDKSALEAVIEVRIRLHCLPHCQCDCHTVSVTACCFICLYHVILIEISQKDILFRKSLNLFTLTSYYQMDLSNDMA